MKKSEIDSLTMAMACTETRMLDKEHVVSDQEIIEKISTLSDCDLKDGMGRTLLMYAAIYKRAAIVTLLIHKAVNVNIKDNNAFTALHFAVQSGDPLIVRMLLEAGAETNAQNRFGNNPIMLGDNLTPICIFEDLLKHGADPHQRNNFGVSAIDAFISRKEVADLFA